MKIGILTYHYVYNFGATIQAYALRKAIKKMIGEHHDVDIINYVPPTFSNLDENLNNIDYLKQKEQRDLFLKNECGILAEISSDINNIPEYDYYITGSDQVWNPSLPVFEETSEYFLDFVPEHKIKIAYAASIGQSITKNFNTSLFEKNIPRFDFLSVREQSYVPFIEMFTTKKCHAVLDPTFLADISEYERLMPSKQADKPYILCVTYGMKAKRRIYDFVNRYSIRNNYKVIHMEKQINPYLFMNEEETIHYSGLGEILWTIKNAGMVITDSFHFMVFSIIFHRPFYVMLTGWTSRITDLLERFQLKDRIFKENMKLDDMNEDINYNDVEKIMNENRAYSIHFLEEALNDILK